MAAHAKPGLQLAAFGSDRVEGRGVQSLTYRLTEQGRLLGEIRILVELPRFAAEGACTDQILATFVAKLCVAAGMSSR